MVDATVMFEDTAAVLTSISHRNVVRLEDCGNIEDIFRTQSSAGLLTGEIFRQGSLVAAMKFENLVVLLMAEGLKCGHKMGRVDRFSFLGWHSEERCFFDDAGSARDISCGK